MKAPAFWQQDGVLALLLSPLSVLYAAATARRVAGPGWRAPVPVFCCGNATVGGAGKTTLALDLGTRLILRARQPAFLTRGYGGRGGVAMRVQPGRHGVADAGDEALLLAAVAPTWIGADRAATARLAIADGADVLVMDDGLQNPSLVKDFSFLVIDGAVGVGNGRVIPSGPLREPIAAAAVRCNAAVLIGPDRTGAIALLPPALLVLRASLRASSDLTDQRVFAFAGIGRPEKFFETLQDAGAILAGWKGFPDHYRFTAADGADILRAAERLGAVPVTTPKDAVRLPEEIRAGVKIIGVELVWENPAVLERLLGDALDARRP